MENRVQQLTDKLYNEGLEKGRAQADALLSSAREQAASIIEKAKTDASEIISKANDKAAELTRNTANDVRMASNQTLSALRGQIENMVLASVVEPKVSAAWSDGSFIKNLIVEAVKSWSPSSSAPINVVVPEAMVGDVRGAIAEKFKDGVDVVFDGRVKVPFRIAPVDGSYHINFTDSDFNSLISESLRERVAKMLFE